MKAPNQTQQSVAPKRNAQAPHKKPRLFDSLLVRLLAALVLSLILFVAATAWWIYSDARDEAFYTQDESLLEVTAALARADVAAVLPRALTMDPKRFEARMESDEPLPEEHASQGRGMGMGMGRHRHGGRMHRRMLEMMGEENAACPMADAANGTNDAASSGAAPQPPRRTLIPAGETVLVRLLAKQGQAVPIVFGEDLAAGFSTPLIDGAPHRLCLLFLPNGRYTAVAEPLKLQEAIVQEEAIRAVTPLLVLLPVLALVLGAILWAGLRPLTQSARNVSRRGGNDLTPLPLEGVPSEVRPFVEAVNGLLARVDAARTRELRFTADAAHELRSPLTSLTIEAEHLGKLPLSDDARKIVSNLESGLERSVHQVSQLLLFARAQTGETKTALLRDAEPWHLAELAGELLEPLLPSLEKKSIRFDAEGLDAAEPVRGLSRTAAGAIIRNLLENAVRYTPAGGAIRLEARQSEKALDIAVIDSGPGIPPEERERVFDPFYRITGTRSISPEAPKKPLKRASDAACGQACISKRRTPPAEARADGRPAAALLPLVRFEGLLFFEILIRFRREEHFVERAVRRERQPFGLRLRERAFDHADRGASIGVERDFKRSTEGVVVARHFVCKMAERLHSLGPFPLEVAQIRIVKFARHFGPDAPGEAPGRFKERYLNHAETVGAPVVSERKVLGKSPEAIALNIVERPEGVGKRHLNVAAEFFSLDGRFRFERHRFRFGLHLLSFRF